MSCPVLCGLKVSESRFEGPCGCKMGVSRSKGSGGCEVGISRSVAPVWVRGGCVRDPGVRVAARGRGRVRTVCVTAREAWPGLQGPCGRKGVWFDPRNACGRKGVAGSKQSVWPQQWRGQVRGVRVATSGAWLCPRGPCGCKGSVAWSDGFVLPQGGVAVSEGSVWLQGGQVRGSVRLQVGPGRVRGVRAAPRGRGSV